MPTLTELLRQRDEKKKGVINEARFVNGLSKSGDLAPAIWEIITWMKQNNHRNTALYKTLDKAYAEAIMF